MKLSNFEILAKILKMIFLIRILINHAWSKAYKIMLYKQKDVLSVFEKFHPKKRKNLNFVYTRLRYALKKFCMQNFFLESVCLTTKFILRLKKTGALLKQI